MQHAAKQAQQPVHASSSSSAQDGEVATEAKGNTAERIRTIHLDPSAPPAQDFVSNKVVTSKYNVITFLPIFLFEMFSRVAYLYFLLQVCGCC